MWGIKAEHYFNLKGIVRHIYLSSALFLQPLYKQQTFCNFFLPKVYNLLQKWNPLTGQATDLRTYVLGFYFCGHCNNFTNSINFDPCIICYVKFCAKYVWHARKQIILFNNLYFQNFYKFEQIVACPKLKLLCIKMKQFVLKMSFIAIKYILLKRSEIKLLKIIQKIITSLNITVLSFLSLSLSLYLFFSW